MARAEVLLQTGLSDNHKAGIQQPPIFQHPSHPTYRYNFFIGTNSILMLQISYDGGLSWSKDFIVNNGVVAIVGFWADWDTPGDSGTKIHIALMETNADDVTYYNFDVDTESLSSGVVVAALVSGSANNASTCISIAKMRGGNLLCVFDIDGGTETGCYRSTDGGVNWTSRANPNEAASSDYYLLAPGFAADNQDAILIFWDRSASEISRKLYDDSADSWAETSISGSMTSVSSTTCVPQFALTVDATNSRIILIAWSNRETLNADLKTWWVTESAITAKTDVVTDSVDDQEMCSLGLATDTNTLYAFYGGKSDGSETAGSAIHIYYKTSTDYGATWGSETKLTQWNTTRQFDVLHTAKRFTGDFATVFRYTESLANTDPLLISYNPPSSGAVGGSPVVGGFIIQ